MAERGGVEAGRVREYVLVPVHKFEKLMEKEGRSEDGSFGQEKSNAQKHLDQDGKTESGGGSGDSSPGGPDRPGPTDNPTVGGVQGLDLLPPDGPRPGINSPPVSGRVTHPGTGDPSGLDSTTSRSTSSASTPATASRDAGSQKSASPTGGVPSMDGDGSGREKAKAKRKGATIADRRKRMRDLWLAL